MSQLDPPESHGDRKPAPVHGPSGDFIAVPATAERDAEAARLRGRGLSYPAIAGQLNVSVSTAYEAVQRALKAIRAEPAAEVRTLELERLDAALERLGTAEDTVRGVLARRHVTVSQGRVVYDGDDAVEDWAPILAAVDRLVRIESERLKVAERRAKLLGLDAEQKVAVSGGVTYEIVGLPEAGS